MTQTYEITGKQGVAILRQSSSSRTYGGHGKGTMSSGAPSVALSPPLARRFSNIQSKQGRSALIIDFLAGPSLFRFGRACCFFIRHAAGICCYFCVTKNRFFTKHIHAANLESTLTNILLKIIYSVFTVKPCMRT